MNLNDAKSVPVSRRRKSRVGRGRGSGWGKTSRRGQKGASSRTGWGGGLFREGGQMPLARRVPKKGFNNYEFRVNYEVVNVERLSSVAKDGVVTPEILKEVGLVKKSARWVKVLGDGEPGGALKVSAHHFSRGAREKIEKAGGAVTVLPGRHGKLAPASGGERHAALSAIRTAELEKAAPARQAAHDAAKAAAAEKAAAKPAKEPKAAKASGEAKGGGGDKAFVKKDKAPKGPKPGKPE